VSEADSLQVTLVTDLAMDCHYFLPGSSSASVSACTCLPAYLPPF